MLLFVVDEMVCCCCCYTLLLSSPAPASILCGTTLAWIQTQKRVIQQKIRERKHDQNNNKNRRSYIATFVSMCLLLCAVRCLGATDTATIRWSGTRPPTWIAHATTPAIGSSIYGYANSVKCPGFHSMGVKSINGTGMSQLDRCRDIHTQGIVL